MNKGNSNDNTETKISIKGTIFFFDRSLYLTVFSLILVLVCLYQIAFTDMVSSDEKFKVWSLAVIGLLFISGLGYWSASSNYFFYELTGDKLTVKSLLKKYLQEFSYDKVVQVNLYGDLAMPLVYLNSIEIKYAEGDEVKYYRYHSSNLKRSNWIDLITHLHNSGVKITDPNESFFRSSEFRLPKQ